ncbi:hypothetical protein FRC08_012202, partial [Ceratobasidium sp. 394]
VRCIQDNLKYISRDPRRGAKGQECGTFERKPPELMHKHVPKLDGSLKRGRRRKEDKHKWARN